MEVIDAIKARRSVREFLNKPIEDEVLRQILEAGLHAPCSKNLPSWQFLVLRGDDKNRVAEFMCESTSEYTDGPLDPQTFELHSIVDEKIRSSTLDSANIIRNADTLILLFNTSPFTISRNVVFEAFERAQEREKKRLLQTREVEIAAVSAAAQNILLAATRFGLGSVWMSDVLPAESRIQKHFGMQHDLVACIALGWPAYKPEDRKVDWSKVVFHDSELSQK